MILKRKQSRRAHALLGLGILMAFIILSAGSHKAANHERVLASELDESLANCRYGVATTEQVASGIPQVGAGWFLKFSPYWSNPQPENNAELVHVFKTFQEKTSSGFYLPAYKTIVPLDKKFANYVRANPGDLWLIGNEVDRGPNPGEIVGGQGDMYPEIYAKAYHEVRAFIKENDPTARTAISGLVEVTPGRLQYLDKVWASYQQTYGIPMPVDVWNMHVYVLPEVEPNGQTPNSIANVALGTDPTLGKRGSGGNWEQCADPDVYCFAEHDDLTIFGEQVTAMRQWMKDHGQQQKPLILSEFSILYPYVDDGDSCYIQDEFGNCFTPERVSSFMEKTFAYLNNQQNARLGYALDGNRLVQQWLWFSMYTDSVGISSNLLERDFETLTPVGETFRQAVAEEPTVVNLVVDEVPKVVMPVDQSGTASARITATFRNNGNVSIEQPFTVTFYEDAARKVEIGAVVVSPLVRGCATNVYTAVVEWPELTPGEYPFWVTVDSGDEIVEGPPQQNDNRGAGLLIINSDSSFIPLIMR